MPSDSAAKNVPNVDWRATGPVDPALLTDVEIFSTLTPEEMAALAAGMRFRRYARGEVVFLRGDPGTAFYVVAAGRVKITLGADDGKELIIARLGPGSFFGELALLDDQARSADATAAERTLLLVLPGDAFRQFLTDHPAVAVKLLPVLTQILRRNAELIHDAAFLDVPARVARTLLSLATESGSDALPPAGVVLPGKITQFELAALVGTSRESVNRCLASFERLGLIAYDKGQITLLRPRELQQRIY
jgi:CRP/FNR family transcriptional regulator, cyclic AMP receptor protein